MKVVHSIAVVWTRVRESMMRNSQPMTTPAVRAPFSTSRTSLATNTQTKAIGKQTMCPKTRTLIPSTTTSLTSKLTHSRVKKKTTQRTCQNRDRSVKGGRLRETEREGEMSLRNLRSMARS